MERAKRSGGIWGKSTALVVGLACALVAFQAGCVVVAAGAAGAGAVAYIRGDLVANLDHDVDAVFAASDRALGKMELVRLHDNKTGVDARLVARTALDKRVEIKLSRVSDKLTKVQIRVGLLGDQYLSVTLLEKIKTEF
jgi:hypothetical protein